MLPFAGIVQGQIQAPINKRVAIIGEMTKNKHKFQSYTDRL